MLLFVTLHVLANLVWIGSIFSVGLLVSLAAKENDPVRAKTVAEVSLSLYRRVAVPAFVVSFAFGVARVLTNPSFYMKAHWFHGKLTCGLIAIALHHVIGAKARRAASGSVHAGASGAILAFAVLVSALGAVLFVIYRSELVR